MYTNIAGFALQSVLEFKITSTAGADLIEVPSMRRDVQLKGITASVAHKVEGSFILGDICRRWRHVVGSSDVVLWTDVREAQCNRR